VLHGPRSCQKSVRTAPHTNKRLDLPLVHGSAAGAAVVRPRNMHLTTAKTVRARQKTLMHSALDEGAWPRKPRIVYSR